MADFRQCEMHVFRTMQQRKIFRRNAKREIELSRRIANLFFLRPQAWKIHLRNKTDNSLAISGDSSVVRRVTLFPQGRRFEARGEINQPHVGLPRFLLNGGAWRCWGGGSDRFSSDPCCANPGVIKRSLHLDLKVRPLIMPIHCIDAKCKFNILQNQPKVALHNLAECKMQDFSKMENKWCSQNGKASCGIRAHNRGVAQWPHATKMAKNKTAFLPRFPSQLNIPIKSLRWAFFEPWIFGSSSEVIC